MFNLFGKRTAKEFLEEAKETYILPKEEKPKQSISYYRIGLTDDNRVSFTIRYDEITMNVQGVDDLIAQLQLFRDQLNRNLTNTESTDGETTV